MDRELENLEKRLFSNWITDYKQTVGRLDGVV